MEMVVNIVSILKAIEIHALVKMVNFMLCEFYLNKKKYRKIKDADWFLLLFLVVKGNRKCELNCQAMGYRFYVRQAEKVIDGTPCDQNGTAICVSGQCKVSAPDWGIWSGSRGF